MKPRRAIIAPGQARTISNGSLVADCPFHETGEGMLHLYPAPLVAGAFYICFGCGERGSFTPNADGSHSLEAWP